jgi:hypothetical protein
VDLDLRRFGTGMTYLFLCGFVGDWTWDLRRFGTGMTISTSIRPVIDLT